MADGGGQAGGAGPATFSQAFAFVRRDEAYRQNNPPPPPPPQQQPQQQQSQPQQMSQQQQLRAAGRLLAGAVQLGPGRRPTTAAAADGAPAMSPAAILAANPTCILVSRRQEGNSVLRHIRNVRWQFVDQLAPDFLLGASTAALYLSLRYHLIHPECASVLFLVALRELLFSCSRFIIDHPPPPQLRPRPPAPDKPARRRRRAGLRRWRRRGRLPAAAAAVPRGHGGPRGAAGRAQPRGAGGRGHAGVRLERGGGGPLPGDLQGARAFCLFPEAEF